MSDNLSIQPATVQERKNPYLSGGIGAVAGAAAGYGATALYNSSKSGSAKTVDELIAEANGNDKVELTTKKNAVEDAEKKLSEAGKAVYEGSEKSAAEAAAKARDAELARLTETTTGSSKEFSPKNWDKLGIDSKDLPATNERTGKPFTTNKGAAKWEAEVQAEYNRLKHEYETAVTKFDAVTGGKDLKNLNNMEQEIQQYLDDTYNTHKGTKPSKLDNFFTTETGWGKHTNEYKRAKGLAQRVLPTLNKESQLTDAQIQSFAEKLEKGETKPAGYHVKTIYETVEGKRTPVKYMYNAEMFKDFKDAENAKVLEQQNELIDSLLDRAKTNIGLQKQAANFDKNFVDSIPDSQAEKTGMFTAKKGGRKEVNINDIINEANIKGKKGKPDFYDADLKKVEKAIEKDGATGTSIPKGLKGTYKAPAGTTMDLQTLQDMITSRKEILKDYNAESKALKADIKSCLNDHAALKELKEKISTARNADEGIAKAKEALINQFPQLGENVEKAGLTKEQAMEKESYKRLAKIAEEKQAAYEKVAANKGKINEGAKKAAEDAVNKAKSDLDALVKDLNGKVKGMSGGAKAAVIGGLAVVGGLLGMSMANSKNKAAEEAEKQIIA